MSRELLEKHLPAMIALRRDLHAHPELGFEETRTAGIVAEELRKAGIEVTEGVGRTGVVGTLRGRRPGQGAIALRADMDALALTERTGLPHASRHEGRMHACGHDGHTTMLLTAAKVLAEAPDFAGTVHFVFQPAEEGRGGARAMLEDKLFERFPADAVYGIHNMPGAPAGHFAIRKGPFMAGSGRFMVTFRGTGGHGGNSAHLASDITLAQAIYIQALQGIVARNVAASDTAVVSVGYISGGDAEALNVMPSELKVGGTMRAFTQPVQELLEKRIRELAELAAATQGATVEVEMYWNAIPTINHDEQTEHMIAAARAVVGDAAVNPNAQAVTGGEDFSFMLRAKPGAFIFLGNGEESHALHTPLYEFNDEALGKGAAFWVELVRQQLSA
ncbi:amidohydrolase [Acetobacteraceae bacterium H6797]|nr:amidohydrolase [Acetobacteraceae bacterium H6797]